MNFATAVRHCLRHCARFSGRARRVEFWWFTLFNAIVSLTGLVITLAADAVVTASGAAEGSLARALVGVVTLAALVGPWLALLLPTIAVTVRRLHDTDRSGWWYLLSLIPLGGWVLLAFTVSGSTVGANRHGPDPEAVDHAPAF